MPGGQSKDLQLAMQNNHIELFLNEQVREIEHTHGLVSAVTIGNGISIPTQAVIIATGVRSNTELALAAGITVGPHGVVVDNFFATSDPAIFAAGDMVQSQDQLTGRTLVTRLWPDAMNQGMRAAMAMAGAVVKPYPGIMPLVKSHFFGFDYLSLGWQNADDLEVICCTTNSYSSAVQLAHGRITGISVLGKDFDIGLCRRAVLTNMTVEDYCSQAGH